MQRDTINSPSIQVEKENIRLFSKERFDLRRLFTKMDATDYMMIWFLRKQSERKEEHQKFYLKDIAETFELPLHTVTNIVRNLQEKNMISWKHDGMGEAGTYVQVTEIGTQAMKDQHQQLEQSVSNIMEQFGEERFLGLLRELAAFEEILNGELEKGDTVYA